MNYERCSKDKLVGLLALGSISLFANEESEKCQLRVAEAISQIQEVSEASQGYQDREMSFIKSKDYSLARDSQKAGLRLQDKIEAIARQVCP